MFEKNKISLINLNQTLRALTDYNRRKILKILKQHGPSPVNRIAKDFSITLPSLSHHLNVLKNINLVDAKRKGQEIYYSINRAVFDRTVSNLLVFFNQLKTTS